VQQTNNIQIEKHTNGFPKIWVEEAMLSTVDRENDKNPMKVVIANEALFEKITKVNGY